MTSIQASPAAQPQINRASVLATVGCVTLFLLPFLGAGTFVAGIGIRDLMRGQPLQQVLPMIAFGAVFLGAATMLFTSMIRSLRASRAQAAFRAQYADRPWLWRKEWSDGVMFDRKGRSSWALFAFAIVFTAASSPILWIFRSEVLKKNYVVLIGLILPLLGAGFFIAAIYQLLRLHKFGMTRCRLDHVPIEPGHAFRGQLETRVSEVPAQGFGLRLTCVNRVTTGAGRNRSTSESILWRDEQTVSPGSVAPTPDGIRVPFTFTVPADAQPSDETNADDAFVWRLDVTAELPGIDFAAQFELPVFNTADAPHTAVHFADIPLADVSSWRPSPESLISCTPLAQGGEEIRVLTHAHFRDAIGLGAFTLVWLGFVALMIYLHAGFFFPFIFLAFGVLLLWLMIDFILGRSTIRASRDGLMVSRSWLGFASTRTYAANEIESVSVGVGMTSGGGSGMAFYDVRLKLRNGRQIVAAKFLRNRKDAEMLGVKIEQDCLSSLRKPFP